MCIRDRLWDLSSHADFVLKKWVGSSTALMKDLPLAHVDNDFPKSVLGIV